MFALEGDGSGLKFQLTIYHCITWASDSASVCFPFLICKAGGVVGVMGSQERTHSHKYTHNSWVCWFRIMKDILYLVPLDAQET